MTTNDDTSTPPAPTVRITSGNPSTEEVAAVVVALAAMSAGGDQPQQPVSRWARPMDRVRAFPVVGRGQWQAWRG